MADFCYDFDPGGLGGEPPMGDFNYAIKDGGLPELKPGYEIRLGICEGHGGCVYLVRDEDGSLWFEHGPGRDYRRGVDIEVPARKKVGEPS